MGVMGVACPARGCQGRLVQEYSDKAVYDQLKFYETLFDVDRAQGKVCVRVCVKRKKDDVCIYNKKMTRVDSDKANDENVSD